MSRPCLRVGMPKGRLEPYARQVLAALEAPCRQGKALRFFSGKYDAEFHLLKIRDIPALVGAGLIDVGIASDEWILESGARVSRVHDLGWCQAELCVLSPRASEGGAVGLASRPLRVVTEFENLARRFLNGKGVDYEIVKVHGSCEALAPGVADVAIDLVETGETMRQNGLKIEEKLHQCSVHLISGMRNPEKSHELANDIISMNQSITQLV